MARKTPKPEDVEPQMSPEVEAYLEMRDPALPEEPRALTIPAKRPVPAETWNPTLLQARFPKDLSNARAMAQFVAVCRATNLNPFMMEILPLHGRAYITEAGWMRLIDERAPGQLVYDEVNLAEPEDYDRFGIKATGWLARATVRRFMPVTGKEREVHDWAFLSSAAVRATKVSAVQDEPWRQCMKQARLRALRKAFPEVLYTSMGYAEAEGEPITIDVLADDGAQDGGLSGAIEQEERKEAEGAERSRFWARANQQGLKHGSAKLIAWLETEYEGSIKPDADPKSFKMKEWMESTGVSWFDLNAKLDALEKE